MPKSILVFFTVCLLKYYMRQYIDDRQYPQTAPALSAAPASAPWTAVVTHAHTHTHTYNLICFLVSTQKCHS